MGKELEKVKTKHRPARRSNAASAIAEAEFAAMDFGPGGRAVGSTMFATVLLGLKP